MPWYSKSAVRLHTGYSMRRASMLRCMIVPAIHGSGYSQARAQRPKTRFMTWRIGMGRTAPSRFVVRKSQKTFGQKKPSKDAAVWSKKNLSAFSQEDNWCRGMLTGSSSEDNQTCPVVFDELSHEVRWGYEDPRLGRSRNQRIKSLCSSERFYYNRWNARFTVILDCEGELKYRVYDKWSEGNADIHSCRKALRRS